MPDPRWLWSRIGEVSRAHWALAALAVALLAVAALQSVTGGVSGSVSRALMLTSSKFGWAGVPGDGVMTGIADGDVWRIVTSGLVTFEFWALVLNIAALCIGGVVVDRLLGWRRLLVLYATATVAAAWCTYLFEGALVPATGAAAPIVGVLGCSVALQRFTGRRERWPTWALLSAYGVATGFELLELQPVTMLGGLAAGIAYAVVHALVPHPWERRAVAGVWSVFAAGFVLRTVNIRSSALYSSSAGELGGILDGLLTGAGSLAAGLLLLGVCSAVLILPPGKRRLERQVLAAQTAVQAQIDMRGACPESIMYGYTHQAAEYALLTADDDADQSIGDRDGRDLLVLIVVIGAAGAAVFAALALAGQGVEHPIWWFLWYAGIQGALPLVAVLVTRRWSRRASQHDRYVAFNGPYPDETERDVNAKQRQAGAVQLAIFAATVMLGLVAAANEEDPLLSGITIASMTLTVWIWTYYADKGRAIKAFLT